MRFSTALTIFAATLIVAAPTPDDQHLNISEKDDDGKKTGGSIAACETATAAQQVACITNCGKDAACITDCSAKAVAGYTSCAGV
ncbi:hypothetical protein ColTof4_07332 [Colletotrichum tofieldiae]|uniref:Uncharacterized protein n=1 Tax=Colletotrichum tofieldiae TaxID=708197 RepID=A0A166U9X8_9PEZI|nr:hypothetical protein CT0861_09467 [Colletotrichum tofieldiae]GKT64935.1 hypothetical protein ColTof3_12274 [Colletotrichum tofieldiae]GKT74909.1 hypothetical protein ColTof4_07332 [Colletotrichum tofieldiae]GKT92115.1 hypothetical protein Ct61P_09965 [Colletotrichum tofieldiae]